jgi:hypothetical protein
MIHGDAQPSQDLGPPLLALLAPSMHGNLVFLSQFSCTEGLTCYPQGSQDAFVLGTGKGKNLLSMNSRDIFSVRDLNSSLARIHSTMDLLPQRCTLNHRMDQTMKSSITSNWVPLLRAFCASLIAFATLWAMPRNAHAQLYVVQQGAGIVSEYHATTGEVIRSPFIKGGGPSHLAVKGDTLFVDSEFNFTVRAYDATTGAVIDASFIKLGFEFVGGLAVKDNTLFVALPGIDTVGAYDATTGAAINANFLTGVDEIGGLAVFRSVSEQKEFLFVTNRNADRGGTVGKYDATTGAAINANFITGLHFPTGLAVKNPK